MPRAEQLTAISPPRLTQLGGSKALRSAVKSMGAFGARGGGFYGVEEAPKLGARRLQLLEIAFGAYVDEDDYAQGDGARVPNIDLDTLEKVANASMCRFLDREVEELMERMEDSGKQTFELADLKNLVVAEQPFLISSWRDVLQNKNCDPEDIFNQLFEAHKTLVESSDGPGGEIDVHSFEYVVSTCGDPLHHDDFEEIMRKINHPPTGEFQMQRLMKYLGDLLEEIGMEGSEELAKVASTKCDALKAQRKRDVVRNRSPVRESLVATAKDLHFGGKADEDAPPPEPEDSSRRESLY